MGSEVNERDRDKDEGPQNRVHLSKGFYLGTYEVTQAQWYSMMGNRPSAFQQGDQAETHPVESVSWYDCEKFLSKLSQLGMGHFRFPTEAEWEYACRAGTSSRFYWGDIKENWEAYRHAWTNSRSFATTHPVGSKPPNPWGLYDMSGNVWEWCADWYGPYTNLERKDPTGPAQGKSKVFRGGSFFDFPKSLRSANRHRHRPEERYTAVGLRVVWEPRDIGQSSRIQFMLPGRVPLELVKIPAGQFLMGSSDSEQGRQGDEGPQHIKIISEPFYMGKFEITQEQWQSITGSNPSTFQRLEKASGHPVERVSWREAQTFVNALNDLNISLGNGEFSLPTEVEWEYACRAGSTTRFPWGEDPDYQILQQHAWFNSRSEAKTHPVGSKKPNPWGLYDMHGNVWEWCLNSYDKYGSS